MSASTAIGMVSESLRNLLVGEMTLAPAVDVTILAPDETGGNRRINLFLYKVQENTFLKNQDWRAKPGDPTKLVPPPLSLHLYYLLTPYAPNDVQTGNSAAHEFLGEAMRVFFENPVIPEGYLVNGLKGAPEKVKIALNTLDLDELSKVWSTFTQPFRLSVLYEVSVVQVDALTASEKTMANRVTEIGVPEIRANMASPVVDSISPSSGPAGTVVTFTGRNLDGWFAYVVVMSNMIANAQPITGDSFTVTLPNDLPAGFHQIRVDVSHLFRSTFLFEVTP